MRLPMPKEAAALTLKPSQELSEAPLLEAVAAYAPGDADAAGRLAQIYLGAKKEEEARRVMAELGTTSTLSASATTTERLAVMPALRRGSELSSVKVA